MIIKNKNATFKFEYDNNIATLTLLDYRDSDKYYCYFYVKINDFSNQLMKIGDEIKLEFTSFWTEKSVLEALAKSGYLTQKETYNDYQEQKRNV